jgi:hypothetical protein
MDFNSLGKRDIFGILLPGILPVLIGAYALYAALLPFKLDVASILGQQFLLTVLLFASAYLVGNLLRLSAADIVDKESSKYILDVWRKKQGENIDVDYESKFRERMNEFLKGDGAAETPPGFPSGFDGWLWGEDTFPYVAWHNRLWMSHGFQEILDFFQQNHKARMWPQNHESPKSFFNYCKLAVIDGGGTLADEVNTAEGNTRFFAGTLMGMRLSIWLLKVSIIFQVLVIIGLALAQIAGVSPLALDWTTQIIYLILSLLLRRALFWMCGRIIEQFRTIRLKEAGTVFSAFYLYVTRPYRQEDKKKKKMA